MKKIFLFSCILIFSLLCGGAAPKKVSVENMSWRLLEKAYVLYDNADFGEALDMATKAKESRAQESNYEFTVLDKATNPKQVMRVGAHFEDVIKILQERDEIEAVAIIKKYIELHGTAFFNESIRNLITWLKEKSVYPEADYLIGKIYQLEGEYVIADKYYQDAYRNSKFLDIPDEKFDILYSMAKLAKEGKDIEKYENVLTLILSHNEGFSNKVLLDAMVRLVKTDKAENVDRFFVLFRSDCDLTLNALYQIISVYEGQEAKELVLKCVCLGTIEAFTHLNNCLVERDSDYKYTTFENFLTECGKYPEIVEWCSNNYVWELFNLLGQKSIDNNCLIFGRKVFYELSKNCPDEYWRNSAHYKLVK